MQTIDLTTLATVTGGTTCNKRLLHQLDSLNSSLRAATQPQASQQQLETLMVGALAASTLRRG
jgi:hypothetical protein